MVTKVLITGANVGCGFECARQLALKDGMEKIILACRNQAKADAAKRKLEDLTGKKNMFDIVIIDVSSLDSVRNAVNNIREPIDGLVLNAGGFGDAKISSSGVTNVIALNVLGSVLLFDLLVERKMLIGGTAVYVSSEITRGIPGASGYKFKDGGSVSEFTSLCDGSGYDSKWDTEELYGVSKLVGTMWFLGMAIKYTNMRIFAVSPGVTGGTDVMSKNYHPLKGFVMNRIVMPLGNLLGKVNSVEVGTKRYVDLLCDEEKYSKSGVFYASKTSWPTGEMCDQIEHLNVFGDATYQDNASTAIHSFVK